MADPKFDPAPAYIDKSRTKLLFFYAAGTDLEKTNHSNHVEAASVILPVTILIFVIT